jgi:hypothetical protein
MPAGRRRLGAVESTEPSRMEIARRSTIEWVPWGEWLGGAR